MPAPATPLPAATPSGARPRAVIVDTAVADDGDWPFDAVIFMALRARRMELLAIDAQLGQLALRLGANPAARRLGQAQANARAARVLIDRALVEAAGGASSL